MTIRRGMTSIKRTHWSHPHPLEKVDRPSLYTCDGCMMDGSGPRYRCELCNFDLDQECMFAAPTITFQGHKCHFLEKPLPAKGLNCHKVDCNKCGRSCDACGMTVKGFVYHCAETGWDFHPRCAKLQSEIFIGDVKFSLEKQGPSECQWCKKKWLKGSNKRIPGWSYMSRYNYNLHVYCVMDMAMQTTTTTTTTTASSSSKGSGRDLSVALEGVELPLIKSKDKGGNNNKWLGVLKIFLQTLISILLGDPTTIVASTLAHLVTQGFFHAG